MEPPPKIIGFLALPSVALRSVASFLLSMKGVILETESMLRLLKLMTNFKCGPTKVGHVSLGPQSF